MLALLIEVHKYFFNIIHLVLCLVMERSVPEMMFVVIQFPMKRDGRVHGRPQEKKHRRPHPLKIKNPYRGLLLQVGAFLSLLGHCLGLLLLQKILWESMVVSKQDVVTATKATQIHGASNVMFVYALQKPETAT